MSPHILRCRNLHYRSTSFESCFIKTMNLLPFKFSQCILSVLIGSSFLKTASRSSKSLLFPILSFKFLSFFRLDPNFLLFTHLKCFHINILKLVIDGLLMISYWYNSSVGISLRSKGECSRFDKSQQIHRVSCLVIS